MSGSIRTSCLFHFMREMDVLKSILKTGIIPNFCKEDLHYYKRGLILGIPMVSFCDIPLTRTTDFKERYGEFAIGLSKEWAIKNRINPILYVNDLSILTSLGFLNTYRLSLEEEVKKHGGDDTSIPLDFSPKSLEGIKYFFNRNNAREAVYSLYGYVKKYISPGKEGEQVNYLENEWRYVVTGSGIDWKWSEDEYTKWRGAGKKPEPSKALKDNKLKFGVEDVSYVIVESDGQIAEMVDYIQSLTCVGGNEETISDEDRKILLTKIISQERIGADF